MTDSERLYALLLISDMQETAAKLARDFARIGEAAEKFKRDTEVPRQERAR